MAKKQLAIGITCLLIALFLLQVDISEHYRRRRVHVRVSCNADILRIGFTSLREDIGNNLSRFAEVCNSYTFQQAPEDMFVYESKSPSLLAFRRKWILPKYAIVVIECSGNRVYYTSVPTEKILSPSALDCPCQGPTALQWHSATEWPVEIHPARRSLNRGLQR